MLEAATVFLGVLAIMIVVGVLVVVIFVFESLIRRVDDAVRDVHRDGIRQPIAERREHRRNVRALKHQTGPPIERLGSDLRRIRRSIRAGGPSSATQQAALRQAYDEVLAETCTMLNLTHELDRPTIGTERDIERLRVEAVLEAHGIVIDRTRRHDQNA